ncbi:MAG: type I glutamate--ammonia ligase [Chloroflexi bacterium]|nr:type I glutamate--ammonia ligase [Chloroflexota bacterium]
MNDQHTRRELAARMAADGVQFVSLQFTDIPGTVKNVTIPVQRLDEALERGVWFDGSSIEGFARIYETDMMLLPDPATYCIVPWEPDSCRVARLLCDIYTPQGELFAGDPRHILKRALAQAEALGFQFNIGPEFEFFLFRMDGHPHIQPVPHDVGSYFDFSPRDTAARVRQDISATLEGMGIQVEKVHHEVAAGQHEIDIHYADALTSADHVITAKYAIRAVAQLHGLCATFMPKPVFGINGSGMHTHQSLFAQGHNAFFAADDPYHLSPTAYQFIAGQLVHAASLAALVAPTVNSYKRLVPGYEAPAYICWGQVNRSALIRIPRYSPGWEQAVRAELRCPDPSCNPYLAFAGMLAAGLDGIRRQLTPPAPVEENVYDFDDRRLHELHIDTLPRNLGEALEALAADPVLGEALGPQAADRYLEAKWREWREYSIQVTEWERERYLETS